MFAVNTATVPTAKVTAIVSPTARLKARIMPAIIPEEMLDHYLESGFNFVAPKAKEPSRNSFGTALNASSDIEAISGKIITPTTIAPLIGSIHLAAHLSSHLHRNIHLILLLEVRCK